jgi:hypothetical protein
MVAGVALFDYDNDGYLDVYLVNGAAIPSLKKEGPKYWNRLYHNNHDGTFTDVTEKAGVAGEGYGMGVAIGDYDNDGWPDIYVVNTGKNQLFHNNKDGTFTDVTDKAGVGGGMLDGKKMWSVSAAWVDYNNDGLPDLFVSNYCKWEVNKDPFCGPKPSCARIAIRTITRTCRTLFTATTAMAHSRMFPSKRASPNMRARGWAWRSRTTTAMGSWIFSWPTTIAQLLVSQFGGKKFEEVALEAGVAYTQSGSAISGMGADFKDVDNDGRPDIWHTATENESFPLFQNRGDGQFWERTFQMHLLGTRDMSGWGNGIFDFDNDGWKDLFVARGNVLDNVALFTSRKYEEPNAVFRNLGNGKFQDVSSGSRARFPEAGGASRGGFRRHR